MAFNDDAVFTAAVGHIFTAPVGTAPPTAAELAAFDPDTFSTTNLDWETLGHTSEEELPEFGFEGGEKEIRGTWQKKNLREVSTDTPVDYITMQAQQFDSETLALYYGTDASAEAGVFGVNSSDVKPVERAFLLVLVDGDNKIGFAAHKASIRRDESISLSTDAFASLPLRATFIKETGQNLFQWILPAEDTGI